MGMVGEVKSPTLIEANAAALQEMQTMPTRRDILKGFALTAAGLLLPGTKTFHFLGSGSSLVTPAVSLTAYDHATYFSTVILEGLRPGDSWWLGVPGGEGRAPVTIAQGSDLVKVENMRLGSINVQVSDMQLAEGAVFRVRKPGLIPFEVPVLTEGTYTAIRVTDTIYPADIVR